LTGLSEVFAAAGSFGMLYIPSIVFYFTAGAVLSAVLTGVEIIKRRNRFRNNA